MKSGAQKPQYSGHGAVTDTTRSEVSIPAPGQVSAADFDANVSRLKACEHIADGDDGWQALRNECPSTAAVSRLRDQYEALQASQTVSVGACAKCGYPAREHSANGGCYGICGKYEPPQAARMPAPVPEDVTVLHVKQCDGWTVITSPQHLGLYVAHQQEDVAMADVFEAIRTLVKADAAPRATGETDNG